ncbi:MAG: glycosyltransferase family 2 protein [Turicibacter sp.]|nr:glycosyltransferase family 2 protein [Turicibacter sp.]
MNLSLLHQWNTVFFVAMTALYGYQLLYLLIPFLIKGKKIEQDVPKKTFGIVIAARNEAQVIGELIKSIHQQNYPGEKVKIFVIADNCTDETAMIARNLGAVVWERFDQSQVGKGYALNYLFKKLSETYGKNAVDAYLIFDADNVLDENYLLEMNKHFVQGHEIITSYRNSKNYAVNWLSAGQSLYFLQESQYKNRSRALLGSGCPISGTGFLVSADIINEQNGWHFHTLVEDIEFSVHHAIAGNKIAYCEKAVFYDEQPTDFNQSWNQRLRWGKGFYQVFIKYGLDLFLSIFRKGSFYAFDIFMKIFPLGFLTGILLLFNLLAFGYGLRSNPQALMSSALVLFLVRTYTMFFIGGLITVASEWNRIYATPFQKIGYLFTYPLFVLTFAPISMAALIVKVEWKPIIHKEAKSLALIRKNAE